MKKLLLMGCMLLIAAFTSYAAGSQSSGKLQTNMSPTLLRQSKTPKSYTERPEFTSGDPLYLTGDAANIESPWDPASPAEFIFADGVYTFEAKEVSQIKISYTPGDWDTFLLTAMSVTEGYIDWSMVGNSQPLTWSVDNICLPFKADYKIVVAGDLSSITVTTDAQLPDDPGYDDTPYEIFMRGDMNNWQAPAEWQFEHVYGPIYKLVTPEAILPGWTFKIADAIWGKINWCTEEIAMSPEVVYQMFYNTGTPMGFAEDFNGVIWIDVNSKDPKFECSENVNYIPKWVEEVDEENWITVNVEKPGELAETYLSQNDYDWNKAVYLKVTGSLHAADLNAIKNMPNLKKIDLEETDITEIPSLFMNDRKKLNEIYLPSTLQTIGYSAFSYCSNLGVVKLKGIKTIGEGAFSNCQSLKSMSLPGIEKIEASAFYNCTSLTNIELNGAKYIGNNAFQYCNSLADIDLSTVEELSYGAFNGCGSLQSVDLSSGKTFGSYLFKDCISLTSVTFPSDITTIPGEGFTNTGLTSIVIPMGVELISHKAFAQCKQLTDVTLPATLKNLDSGAFEGCSQLSSITIPASVNFIGSDAFYDTAITEFKCLAVAPPALSGSIVGGTVDMTKAYLYVPSFSKDYYRNTQYWNDFFLMRSLQEPIDYMMINRPLTINLEEEDNDLIANKPAMELTAAFSQYGTQGELTATGEGTLSARELKVVAMPGVHSTYYDMGYYPTLINYAEKMRADDVCHSFTFRPSDRYDGLWYFMSLPYDVKVSDIAPSKDTYWVIRRYDSALRAAGETGKTWVNLTNDDTLEAGKGYIVSIAGGEITGEDQYGNPERDLPNLTFRSGNSITKNNLFRSTDVIMPLAEYEAEYAHNRSWNFIGNPYPSYFDMHCLNEEFTAPITIWTGRGYTAYSPVDDDLVLAPYEAFFVQCPLNATSMTFKEEGRMHKSDVSSRSNVRAPLRDAAAIIAEERNVFNFNITGNDYEDRARIVLNPEAKSEYELGRDASKFFADNSENAQIFVSGDALYSIDERPVAAGEAVLGLRGGNGHVYRLSLSGRHSDEWQVILTDSETGITVDLGKQDYEFVAGEKENASRFAIRFMLAGNGASGLDKIESDFGSDAEVSVVAANGMVVFNGRISEITVPESGLYIISNGREARKTILTK